MIISEIISKKTAKIFSAKNNNICANGNGTEGIQSLKMCRAN